MSKLKNLHECMQDANYNDIMYASSADYQSDTKPRLDGRVMVVQSYQLDYRVKQAMDEICKNNGATASSFLRECTRHLVSEYEGIEVGSKQWVAKYGEIEGRSNE